MDIDRIAYLARIKLDEKLKEKLKKDIEEILKAFSIVENLDGEKALLPIDVTGNPREDIPEKKEFDLWKNAKYREDNYIIGPKVR
ncbi:NEQ513 [Nanoarchaeum equitans Kin4-M]|uniref:NEQ513 n=1 Tax=Nanoarchaeum equitans (strain Kin4-M) TaxID=228908 RepID=Q74MX4_NANEQ|nr:NEQ513 [Nanoarchaeum equitans Kin4-M]